MVFLLDDSNHAAGKIFPLLIQYFDWKNGAMQNKLFKVKNTPTESADTIAQYIKETLEKNGIFSKYIVFSGGKCNTIFRGIWRDEEGENVFAKLKSLQNKS